MLQIENYTKRYGDFLAVDRLDMHVRPGTLMGFIGHNGAGKTTTLRSVAGILDFEDGTIRIDGTDIKQDPIRVKSLTAFIPDNPELYEFLTGAEYLDFISDVFELDDHDRQERITKYANSFELQGNLSDRVSSYSHGMKQKLALIGALIHEPKLLLLDEPFVGLDPIAARTLRGYLREVCDKGGAVVFSTHVLEVAQKICDEIAIIKNGRLVVQGETQELTQNASLEDIFVELSESEVL
ncbi:MAG TPA: ABC transporter ATP-binding protein [Tissierellia bacterium]|nr:ABC transporter ATP-binding protein [Tissierellia bacterium]